MSEWKRIKFTDIVKDSGYGPRFSANLYSEDGNALTIRATDISEYGEILYEQAPKAMLDEKMILNHALKENDLIVITTANCGLSAIFRDYSLPVIPSAYTVKIALNEHAHPEFMKYLMISDLIQNQVKAHVRKGTVANLALSDIHKFDIPLPPLEEQRKIAAILGTWDKAIGLVEQLIAALQARKKGLIQKLLTGEVRFAEFAGVEWELFNLGELGQITSGGTPDTTNPDFWDGDIMWCTPTEITALTTKYLADTKRRITKAGVANSSTTLLPPFSLLVTTRATIGEIAINTVEMTTNQGFKNITPNSEQHTEFLYYLLRFNKHELERLASGSTFAEISKKSFQAIELRLPKKDEQIAVSDVLGLCDRELETLNEQKELLQEQKRGLMQVLLTGKLRV